MISKSLTNRIFQSIEEFSIEKYTQPLGVGSFGTVRLGTHKCTNKTYAIKIICVDQEFKQNEVGLLERQIGIHYSLNHPHIIKLWDVLQEIDRIYMIMQYAHKGNLFNFQSQYKTFSQAEAFKIFIQTLDSIDYLHKNNIFHRDIKPQNILLDHQMNIKLCDFGWAAPDITRKRSTFCGTYQYMAPQMIHEKQYDFRIDIWAMGVLLYELIHATAPFPAQTFEEMKVKISSGSYEINVSISTELKNLIMSILQFQSIDRPSIQQIRKNPWMQKMKKTIQNKNTELKFDKKKCKNVYGSLDIAISKHQPSKFGSTLFQDLTNKKQSKVLQPQDTKKKMKKKCKTLEQESIQKLIRPMKNMLTLYTQKENDHRQQSVGNTTKLKDKYKMLSKIALTKFEQNGHNQRSGMSKFNNYLMGIQGQTPSMKNMKSDDMKNDRNAFITNRNLQTADSKIKKKRAI